MASGHLFILPAEGHAVCSAGVLDTHQDNWKPHSKLADNRPRLSVGKKDKTIDTIVLLSDRRGAIFE